MWGGAGMTYEKGTNELYGKQVYDHYLAMDETVNVVTRDHKRIMTEWIKQWEEAKEQGERCELEQNELVSPLHSDDPIQNQPNVNVCGYYYLPDNMPGDTAKFLRELQEVDVEVYKLTEDTVVNGAHEIGPDGEADGVTLPAGTLWIPLAQTQKHWIQTVLGEDPFVPFYFFYDSGQWSYSHTWGMSGGNGLLREPLPAGTPMQEMPMIEFDSATGLDQPVVAFKTDSSEGLALVVDLLAEGVTVYRGDEAFNAGGREFPTGTAFIDMSTAGGVDVAALAAHRDSPLTGLPNIPVTHYDMGDAPKMGVYTGSSSVPGTPISTPQGQCSSGTYCLPLFGLTQKLGFAPTTNLDERTPIVVPVTSTQLNSSATWLKDNGFTAFYASSNISNSTALSNLEDFVNNGGNFVGYGANQVTAARSAGMTNVNTVSGSGAPFNTGAPFPSGTCPVGSTNSIQTPRANFPIEIDTSTPAGWGFDKGGSQFRSSTGNPFDPDTLAGNGGSIPDAVSVYTYPTPLVSYGYTCNVVGPGQLEGRPALVFQEYGSGSVTMFEQDPYYRSWLPQQERAALNAMLAPNGAQLAATPAPAPVAVRVVESADKPVAKKAKRKVKLRKAKVGPDLARQLKIAVRGKKQSRKVRVFIKAVKKSGMPKKVRKKVKWIKTKKVTGIKVRNGRAYDHETMPLWIHRIEDFMSKRKIRASVWEVTRE